VQLHVLEELLESLHIADEAPTIETESADSDTADSETEEMMKLPVHAACGTTSRRSMRLEGVIGKQSVMILIDSGSSSNFMSQQLADKLKMETVSIPMAKVSVAGGGTINCDKMLPAVTWYTQGHKFTTELKLLPLTSYDIILGMDWLENQNNGKMWVNWKKKTMRFKHDGTRITLRGVQPNTAVCSPVTVQELAKMIKKGKSVR
jgi:hypothetical protein